MEDKDGAKGEPHNLEVSGFRGMFHTTCHLVPYSLACFHLFSAPLTRMLGTPQLIDPDLNGHPSQAVHQDMASNVPVAYITQDTRKTLLTPLKLENT